MKLINYLTLVTCAVVLYCCSPTSPDVKGQSSPAKAEARTAKKEKPADPKMRAQALGILDHRIKNYPETYAIVENGILNYEFVHNGRAMSKKEDYLGAWIDFKEDFTYDYGSYSTKEGEGRYHFRTDINQLVMVDNNKGQNPQEWDVKMGGDVLILVGTNTYGNNSFQMKLQRSPEKPIKQ